MAFGRTPPGPTGNSNGSLVLSRLSFAVVAPNVEERVRIRLSDIRLPSSCHVVVQDLRLKAYLGPWSAVVETKAGRPDKSLLKDERLDLKDGVAVAEIELGEPKPPGPWALRIKLYHRPVSTLFAQDIVAEVVSEFTAIDSQPKKFVPWLVVPQQESEVKLYMHSNGILHHGAGTLQPGAQLGSAHLEVLRIVPASALEPLRQEACKVLESAVRAGVNATEIEDLCAGVRELGPETLLGRRCVKALETAAEMGKATVVHKLLQAGVPASMEGARCAEKVGDLELARAIFDRVPIEDGNPEKALLPRALQARLPDLAEQILQEDKKVLDMMPPNGGAAAKLAHRAKAWSVLAALLMRGDPMPAAPRSLLGYALRAGHAELARALLGRHEGLGDIEGALRTCLDHGRLEIVREALEAQWKVRASQWNASAGPPLLDVEFGPAGEPAECGVCFDSLYTQPGVMLGAHGFRNCGHFTCLDCAEHIQDEAANRLHRWRARRNPRIPEPPGPVCPFCRAPFTTAARLTDPTVDPKGFFHVACVPEDWERGGGNELSSAETLVLTERAALGALCALLPLNPGSLAPSLEKELWPQWCAVEDQGVLKEADFLRPGGMLAWISDRLFELKVEGQRGNPPRLQDSPAAWFHHFDFDGKGLLTKPELLRGIAKSCDMSALASPRTPARRKRPVGVGRLREIVEAIWDDEHWEDGISLEDFEGRAGLAEKLLDALPPQDGSSEHAFGEALSVEEALAKARESDFSKLEEDEQRKQERELKQRKQEASNPPLPAPGHATASASTGRREPGLAGAELLLVSLLHDGHSAGQNPRELSALRIQCPFCSAINEARAGAGHRIICGNCHRVFAVPTQQR